MKWYIIVMVLTLGLLVAGCSNNPEYTSTSYLGGTDGVSLGFDVDAPPAEVNFGDDFNVVVMLENSGEFTVEDYFVRLMGFSPTDFGTSYDELTIEGTELLQGNELNVDTGETFESYPVYLSIPGDGMLSYTGPTSGKKVFPFTVEACYRYKTEALADLCIKKDLRKSTDTKVCTISSTRSISASGAPVQISEFKEYGAGAEAVRFTFLIVAANSGGEVSLFDLNGAACDDGSLHQDKVYLTVDTDLPGLTCNGFIGGSEGAGSSMVEGFIKIGSSGSRQISCTQIIADGDRFNGIKPVLITAEYDYLQSVNRDVTIKQYE